MNEQLREVFEKTVDVASHWASEFKESNEFEVNTLEEQLESTQEEINRITEEIESTQETIEQLEQGKIDLENAITQEDIDKIIKEFKEHNDFDDFYNDIDTGYEGLSVSDSVKTLIDNLSECKNQEEVQAELDSFYAHTGADPEGFERQTIELALSSGLADGALTKSEVIGALSGVERMDGNEYVSPENMTEAIKMLKDIDPNMLDGHAPFIAQFIQGIEESGTIGIPGLDNSAPAALPGDEFEPYERPSYPEAEMAPSEQITPAVAPAIP
jgi:hypothetical protein